MESIAELRKERDKWSEHNTTALSLAMKKIDIVREVQQRLLGDMTAVRGLSAEEAGVVFLALLAVQTSAEWFAADREVKRLSTELN